jgi:tetratricopeptide (TPR) repeat protein
MIEIRGFASPEGTYERNKELAMQRANTAKDWLMKQLKSAGFSSYINTAKVKTTTTIEDWKGFEAKLDESNLSREEREKVKKLISNNSDPAKTEKEVIAVFGSEAKAEPYLKPLRRAIVVVSNPSAMREAYEQEEIDSIMSAYNEGQLSNSTLKDIFSKEEYLYASQQTNATAGKVSLIAAYFQQDQGNYKVYSDLGAMSMVNTDKIDLMGGDDAIMGVGFDREEWDFDSEVDVDESKLKIKRKAKREDVKDGLDYKEKLKVDFADGEAMLMKAYELNPSDPVVLNNLGAYYLANEEFNKAKMYLDKSAKAEESIGTHYNLGLYYGRTGNYKKALQHFNKSKEVKKGAYNRGLTKLMLRDYQGAKMELEQALKLDPESTIANYVMAVLAARMNNEQLMADHLKKAIQYSENKNLSDASNEDLEFREYWNNDTFKDAADDDPVRK